MNYHIVKIYFKRETGITDEWIARRIEFFRQHTLKSLQKQTFTDFHLWIWCQAGMEQVMKPLIHYLPRDAVFTFGEHYTERMSVNLFHNINESDRVYVTRIDSDDLYRADAMQIVAGQEPINGSMPECLMFRCGYLYEQKTGRVGTYFKDSTPFHTVIWPSEIFCNREKHDMAFCGDHSKVKDAYPTRFMPNWKFCVLIHDNNFSSTFKSLMFKRYRDDFDIMEFM
jgi:hypothetical protein